MTGPRRFPSVPGIPGQPLPTPDSVPPEERIMREIFALEGRMVSRLGDQHAEAQQERREIREQLGALARAQEQLTRTQTDLTAAVLASRATDIDHAGKLGELMAISKSAGSSAGSKSGVIAAISTVLAAVGGKWLAQKLGINL